MYVALELEVHALVHTSDQLEANEGHRIALSSTVQRASLQVAPSDAQVRDGTDILAFLVPHFVELMMDNSAHGWGVPPYPVVDGTGAS